MHLRPHGTMTSRPRVFVFGFGLAASLALVCGWPGAARAWIFPEHTELTRFAYERNLPGIAKQRIDDAIAAAIRVKLPLCRSVDPLERYHDTKRTCIPYTALPAMAGDHAISRRDLEKRIKSPTALALMRKVSDAWRQYLDAAPPEVQRLYRSRAWRTDTWQPSWENGNAQRRFTRELDIILQATDGNYSKRAAGSRAHFQDSLTPLRGLFGQLVSRGNVDNALAQVFAHHIRSLQLALAIRTPGVARDKRWAAALLEHVQALHFLQDAFASGHIGTEHGPSVDIQKARRHDFLNRVGLNVQRAALGARCENINAAGRNTEHAEAPQEAGCWVAFGDGYLDGFGARVIADAVARLQLQFAMAIGKSAGTSQYPDPATEWLSSCGVPGGFGKPMQTPPDEKDEEDGDRCWHEQWMKPVEEETTPGTEGPFVRFEGEGIAHVHRCMLGGTDDQGFVRCQRRDKGPASSSSKPSPGDSRGQSKGRRWLRVTVYSDEFDPQVAVRKCTEERCTRPRMIASNSNVTHLDPQASTVFEAEEGAVYEFVVGNDGRTPKARGERYLWQVKDVSTDRVPARRCGPLMRAAGLLDPAPVWAQSGEERKRRGAWSEQDQHVWARYVVGGASEALDRLAKIAPDGAWRDECKSDASPCLSSGGRSGANAGIALRRLLGNPLSPCRASAIWRDRSHPLCSTSGGAFDYGSPQASLWRPLVVIWPTPMGDVTVIEGKDAFGTGFAAQVVFGGGPTLELGEDLSWAVGGWFGAGLSYRINSLFPYRENRSLVEANIAIQPMVSMRPEARMLLSGFFEGRFPLIPAVLAGCWGKTFRWEFGPLGYRYYFVWPNGVPGGAGRMNVGHDVEFLNVSLGHGTSARNREAGHVLDFELRMRAGFFREWYLTGSQSETFIPALSAEVAWGHSTYFADL